MSISTEEVSRIAKLARLQFHDTEKEKLQHELASILDYVGQIQELQGGGTELAHDPDEVNLMRDDVAVPVEDPEEFLKQAPGRQDKFIKVKSILE